MTSGGWWDDPVPIEAGSNSPSPMQFMGEGRGGGRPPRAPHLPKPDTTRQTRTTPSVPSRRTISLLSVTKSSSDSTGVNPSVAIGWSRSTQETHPS
jgi:hypothetical protein